MLELFFAKLPQGAATVCRPRLKQLPLHLAATSCGDPAVIEWLAQQHPAATHALNAVGMLPLHNAAKDNPSFAVVQLLLSLSERGAEESVIDTLNNCALDYALESPTEETRAWALTHPRTRAFREYDVLPGRPIHDDPGGTVVVKARDVRRARDVVIKGAADAADFDY